MRRVVVTGLGAVTPLGLGTRVARITLSLLTILGVRRSWQRIIDGESGIVSLKDRREHEQQQCQVAAIVPRGKMEDGRWTAEDWLSGDVYLCDTPWLDDH